MAFLLLHNYTDFIEFDDDAFFLFQHSYSPFGGGRSPEKRTNKCWSLKCNLPDHAVFPEPIQVLFCFHPLSSGQLKFSRADFFCQDSIFPKEIAAPEQRGRPGQRIQAKGDAG